MLPVGTEAEGSDMRVTGVAGTENERVINLQDFDGAALPINTDTLARS